MATPEPTVFKHQLQIFHQHADEVIAAHQPRCELSGRCCRFDEYGHTLFLARSEAEILLQDGIPPDSEISTASCPFQINNLCTAREKRPLGCRTYFCDPEYQDAMPDVSEALIRELKTLHDQADVAWEYRPLVHYLREYQSKLSADFAD
jgi:Fe-S-cluster containining protein